MNTVKACIICTKWAEGQFSVLEILEISFKCTVKGVG